MNKREVSRRFSLWLSVMLVIGIFVVLTVYSKVRLDIGIRCPFYEELHVECPGGGGTRMVEAMMQFDFYQAFRWNPFLFVTLPILAVVYAYQSVVFIFKGKMLPWIDKFVWGYILAFVLFGFVRNMELFAWIRPTLVR